MKNENKFLLMILDGWGIGNKGPSDLIYNTPTPNIDALTHKHAHSQLGTCGENVGLPKGQMGNSEVGHLNIGAGRVIYQDLVRINREIAENSIAKNNILMEAFEYAKKNNKAVHFIGLISDGGVHSMDTHLYKLCDLTKEHKLEKVYIHALTDGRDTDPRSGLGFMKNLIAHLENSNGQIATLSGRYYTMDRDNRWERVKEGYDAIVKGVGAKSTDVIETIKESYKNNITDEFIKPIVMVGKDSQPVGQLGEDDVFICFNFRTDRLRQLTTALTQHDFPEQDMHTIPLHYLTMTNYDKNFKGVRVVYDKQNVENTLGELVAGAGKKQIRIAETEKYAHVTFFFSGGREAEFNNEKRILISSPKVATYDLQPEMSAYLVRDAILTELQSQSADFICLNFANGDMVGHTGIKPAIQKAVVVVDECVGVVVATARQNGYGVMIIADHGNADFAENQDGSPNTAHSLNPVPCILIHDKYKKLDNGILADVAPTILKIMDIATPKDMTGKSLV